MNALNLKEKFTELFYLDREAVNLAKSTGGMAIVLVALILLSTIGAFGFTVAFGATLAVLLDGSGSPRQRAAALSTFAVVGALATLIGNGAGYSMWGSIAATFGVTLICGLALALGPQVGKMAFLVNLWMMIMLSLTTVLYAPVRMALGFFCGSIAVAGLLLLTKPDPATNEEAEDTGLNWSLAPLRDHLHAASPIMHFALSRALVTAFSMWLGWQLNLAHPYWIAMTLLIVVVPDRQQAARTSWQRAIGTVIGVAIGAVILGLTLPNITLLLLWLLVILIMLAVQSVNYVLYASILTLNLILFYQLLETDVFFNGIERLFTTLLGIAFALGNIALLEYLEKQFNRESAME
ncbi:MAG: FUSC family protein [Anaerolineae bacterium]|nr:FUSC family protein [Anaerolineae bacterium]